MEQEPQSEAAVFAEICRGGWIACVLDPGEMFYHDDHGWTYTPEK